MCVLLCLVCSVRVGPARLCVHGGWSVGIVPGLVTENGESGRNAGQHCSVVASKGHRLVAILEIHSNVLHENLALALVEKINVLGKEDGDGASVLIRVRRAHVQVAGHASGFVGCILLYNFTRHRKGHATYASIHLPDVGVDVGAPREPGQPSPLCIERVVVLQSNGLLIVEHAFQPAQDLEGRVEKQAGARTLLRGNRASGQTLVVFFQHYAPHMPNHVAHRERRHATELVLATQACLCRS